MITLTTPAVLLLAVPLLALTLFAWRSGYTNLSIRRQRVALVTRLIILAALVLALAGLNLRLPQSRQAVVVVADLSASDAGQRSSIQTLIGKAAAQRPSSDLLGVTDVGRQPVVEQPVTRLNGFDGFQSLMDPNYTNLAGGLELANALLPSGYQHRIVVASDGQQNVGDALAASRLLRSQGVRVDVMPVHVATGAEVLVNSVDVPAQLRSKESFPLTVTVRSTTDTSTGLTILRDGTLIGSVQERVHPGLNHFTFHEGPLRPGFHSFRVDITPAQDTQPENNEGSAFTSVGGPPRVLVITDQPREAENVVASMKSTGIQAVLRKPAAVTPDLTYLQRFGAVVIVDTAAEVLGPALMAQLVPYVRDLGHGLIVIGGQSSYSMGGYGQTPLEQALPVSMDLPKNRNLPSAAVVLIIESLEEDTQINISKEAGKGVVNLLTREDQVAVNDAPFDGSAGWVVPMQHVTNKPAIDSVIDRMIPGDPESYVPFLQSAYAVLKHNRARVKHIILLGDGDAEDPAYEQLVKQIRAGGVTVSTVATNGAGRNDLQTMQNIAQWGGGRYYQADDPAKIPEIFLREARTVARSGIVQGKFYPQQLSANPMLRDVSKVAPLYGYIATTPKPAGEIVLASKRLDPLLAAWQFGLGRSVAWTSDASGLWTKDWLRAPGANRFWANLVSWTLPTAGSNHLFISSSSAEGEGHISVGIPSPLGASPGVTATVLGPGLRKTQIQLEPTAPSQFGGSFQANAQGAYFITVQARGIGHTEVGQIGLDVPYSAEYRTTGDSMPFLQELAGAGGGSLLTNPRQIWSDNLPPVLAQQSLTNWLLLLALLLLPIDIAVRRLVMSRREIAAVVTALPWRRRAPRPVEPVQIPLQAVRARRARTASSAHQPVPRTFSGTSASYGLSYGPRYRPEAYGSSKVGAPPDPRPADSSPDTSTASQLLAAKRKRS